MRLFAFEGLHYAGRPADVGRLAAPPYDQIDNAARDRFQARSPHQFVHLTRPLPAGGLDMYRHAAELHGRWAADGTLVRDPRPALYPYVIDLAGGGRRLGIAGLAGLDDPRVIRPHEQTLDKPLADRLALLRATHVDLEPILLLSEDGGRLEQLLAEDLAAARPPQATGRVDEGGGEVASDLEGTLEAAAEPLVDHVDADGHHHRLYRIDDPVRIALYAAALNGNPAAIADGHHRYKVAQRFAGETGAPAGTAASAKLAVVTSLASPALTIDPIHRALKDPVDLDRLDRFAAERTPFAGAGGAELAAAVAAAPQPAIGLWPAGGRPEIWRLDPAQAPFSVPAGGRDLPVLLLHEALFPALGLPAAAATDGTVVYRNDPEALGGMLESGEAALGIWLPPMQPAAFAAAIAQGNLLPPKSTRFLPKVMSGLVWADHASRLL